MPDYSLGKVYAIICRKTGRQYIGSTCEPTLARRLSGHVSSFKYYMEGKGNYFSSFEIIKDNDYYIVLLESYPCNSKDELRMCEQKHINLNENINMMKAYQTTEESKEYRKQQNIKNTDKRKKHYEANREELIEKAKENYKKNKDIIVIRKKKHYEENREELLEKRKIKYQNNKEHILEKSNEYYKENKEKIREKKNEKFNCECGGRYTLGNKSIHFKTKPHQHYLSTLNATTLAMNARVAT
jgi:hypothetical protein